ncbi:hypothetical protein B0I33_103233 [Prauserella shujinwangii]|uniref:Uncharacterized protein n=1 Tax=Prauserella shujinwangii TaxID=1453103 RepID=A0A2T0LYN2_9PSEU|nr:hypothetical protein [Prauserella shujinwangii]PRX49200.1 hypothetical protein B0I33_103233 [Prauserella shujinwangii]
MEFETLPYDDRLDYLLRYASDDWLERSTVVDAANRVAGSEASDREIIDMTMKLASDLIDRGAVPGDLIEGDPGFVAWPGTADERLGRLRREIEVLGHLPDPGDVS